jgi:peroxiredoxin
MSGLALVIYVAVAACAVAADSPLGRRIEGFALPDVRGRETTLAELADHPLVVVAFVGVDCPLGRLYAPRLQELADEFVPRGVAFVAIDSNCQDTLAELDQFARDLGLSLPLLKDPGNAVADQFGAERTPEAFVLDAQRAIRYRGRIDDQFGVGIQRPAPQRRDLAEALEELLAGHEVSQPEVPAAGCHIGRVPHVEPHGEVTYSNQIARLLDRRCVECHRAGEVAPFPLTSYAEVQGWGPTMVEVVFQGRMPPWFADPAHGTFANDARLTDDEKELLRTWVANGCPEGDPADLPPPREFADGWQIGQPDQVIYMADEPYTVPAEGVVPYQYFAVDPGFTEDRWIAAAEARPGDRSVVHHILAYIVPPDSGGLDFRLRAGAVGYAPGLPPTRFPEGVALLAPAGSKLVFQMHYTPNGRERQDRSCVGLVFADPQSVRRKAIGGMAANLSFEIPAGAADYEAQARYRVRRDVLLLSLTPHMHLRGKSFRYVAAYPDGTEEILLDVPHYDFNWQLRYDLAEPRRLPAGTQLRCTATFDNSAANPHNPDPTQAVRWGDQTWEEMMIGWFGAVSVEEDGPGAGQ